MHPSRVTLRPKVRRPMAWILRKPELPRRARGCERRTVCAVSGLALPQPMVACGVNRASGRILSPAVRRQGEIHDDHVLETLLRGCFRLRDVHLRRLRLRVTGGAEEIGRASWR